MQKALAIFSPSQNAYSETFIQAHRRLPFNVKFYYGGFLPSQLEGVEDMHHFSLLQRIKRKLGSKLSYAEEKLKYSLQKEGVGMVLAEYGPTACESLRVLQQLKLPLLVHFHGYDASQFYTLQKFGEQYKTMFHYADAVVVVSEHMRNSLVRLGCAAHKLHINYYGPAPVFFKNEPTYSQPHFVAAGRFVAKKNPLATIHAFAIAKEKFDAARLTMIGDGPMLEEARQLAAELNLQQHVHFAGVLQQTQVQQIFANSLAFVQHSVEAKDGDCEGTPVAILEAQAAALPVLSTLHAGIPDVVLHNQTGLLVQEGDVEGLAAQMLRLLREPQLAAQLGNAGRQRVQKHFNQQKSLEGLAAIIRSAAPHMQ